MSNERDTHFANAAKLLVEKTMATNAMDVVDATRFLCDNDLAELQTLFAQFAYDVAIHCFVSVPDEKQSEYGDPPDCVKHVPDLTQWLDPYTNE